MDSSTEKPPENFTGRVLVIDDDVVMREVLSLLLGEAGYDVTTAESGDGALALLSTLAAEQLPSVLLVDLTMPGLSRGTLAVRLRGACPPPAVLVAMSGSEPLGKEIAAFDEFLLKPFTVADMNAAVERARMRVTGVRVSGTARAKTQTPRGSAGQVSSEVLDETIYAKLVSVMGAAALPQLYNLFLDDAPMRIDRMRSAAASGDEGTFVREAHTLKGGCGMLGATELQALAQRTETGGLASGSLLDDFGPAIERVRSILDKHADCEREHT